MGNILVGTASWTDPSLIASKRFYPDWATTAEARLQYYDSQFNIVEVDSSYYALPSARASSLWVERTEPAFVFDVKSFRLFTRHPTPIASFPKDLRPELPDETKDKTNLYYKDVPPELTGELWKRFERGIAPLNSAGKLGTVLFQFPPWFFPGKEQEAHILACQEKLPGYRLAVEFRNGTWVNEKNLKHTYDFLLSNKLAYVCVDEPAGFKSSVPPVVMVTSDIEVVRFHGRNKETWEKPGAKASDRFNYLYSQDELKEWVPKIENIASQTKQLHLLFNNNYQDKSVINARQLKMMLGV